MVKSLSNINILSSHLLINGRASARVLSNASTAKTSLCPCLMAFPRDWIRQSSGWGEHQTNPPFYERSLIMELLKGKNHLHFGRKVLKGKVSSAWQKHLLLPTFIPVLHTLNEKHKFMGSWGNQSLLKVLTAQVKFPEVLTYFKNVVSTHKFWI